MRDPSPDLPDETEIVLAVQLWTQACSVRRKSPYFGWCGRLGDVKEHQAERHQ